eukprot:TRINITY_DN5273_c0_g1_i1.p1 TRINITY_DN5273_c0_g1~~TRINITY_DN5273_c0_g1_i1.p1  ORF type:complete len:416 (+),score=36.08 TRINITY_DN5273_c0_g1_i1:44-1249(+)
MDPVADVISAVCSIENCDAITGRCSAEGKCICTWTYIGDDCATSVVDVYPGLKIYLYVHIAVFSALFLLIALAAGEGIRRLLQRTKLKLSPKHQPSFIILLLVAFIGIERIIYVAAAQYGYVKSFNPVASSVLFGLVIWAIFAIQNMVAQFWFNAFFAFDPRGRKWLPIINGIIKGLIIGFAIFQVGRDLILALVPDAGVVRVFTLLYLVVGIVISFGSAITMLVLGRKLTKQLSRFKDLSNSRQKLVKKVNKFSISISTTLLVTVVLVVGDLMLVVLWQEPGLILIISESFMRVVEAAYCIVVLVSYNKAAGKKSSASDPASSGKNKSQKITAETGATLAETPRERGNTIVTANFVALEQIASETSSTTGSATTSGTTSPMIPSPEPERKEEEPAEIIQA